MKSTVALLCLICILFPQRIFGTCSASTARNVMLTSVFVDIYNNYYRSDIMPRRLTIAPTSDGGAVFAMYRPGISYPRVIKVNSAGEFQWLSQSSMDDSSSTHWPRTIVEDTTDPSGSFIYLGGYTYPCSTCTSFIIKSRSKDGQMVNSRVISKGINTFLHALLVDSSGAIVFGGDYYTINRNIWFGILDKSTLELVDRTVASSVTVFSLIEDGNYYVIGGDSSSDAFCVLVLYKSNCTVKWEQCYTQGSGSHIFALLALGSETYGVVTRDSEYYVVSSSGVVHSLTEIMLLGNANYYSFAYHFDTASFIACDGSESAKYKNVYYVASARSDVADCVWVAGYLSASPQLAFIGKLQLVSTVLSCSGSTKNYMNSQCLSPSASSCFGLCPTCLLAMSPDACYTTNEHADAVNLFAGRCGTSGYHYNSNTSSCQQVSQSTQCHKLCGGECLEMGDSNKCAHHCEGSDVEPYIDTSKLGKNVCRCQLNAQYSPISAVCQIVTGCSGYCGTGGCGMAGDNTKCVNCAETATRTEIVGSEYVQCACHSGTVLSGVKCLSCHALCNNCGAPADNTRCLDCIATPNLAKSSTTVSPGEYTCACSGDSVFDTEVGLCIFTSGCHALCASKCTARDDSSACLFCGPTVIASTSVGAYGQFTCACATGTVFNGTACITILTSGCHPLCDGTCTVAADKSKCVACSTQKNVVSSAVDTYFRECTCADGTELVRKVCAYSEGCSEYCNGTCTVKGDEKFCTECVEGITGIEAEDMSVTCACPTNTAYSPTNHSCISVVTSASTCHPFCNSTCTVPASASSCVSSCANLAHVIALSSSGDLVSCGCSNGTRLNSAGDLCVLDISCDALCESCSSADTCLVCITGEGVIMSNGKCMCATASGYVMVSDETTGAASCVQSRQAAAQAASYSGFYHSRVTLPYIEVPWPLELSRPPPCFPGAAVCR